MVGTTEWEGLLLTWLASGGVSLTDPSVADEPFATIAVRFPEPARCVGRQADGEECDEVWQASGETSTVKWRAYSAFRLTVDAAASASPTLGVSSVLPCQTWLAGRFGFVLLDPGRPDGRLVAMWQEQGDSQLSSGRRFLVRHGGPARLSWVWEWIDHPSQLAERLPGWWPSRTTLASGDQLVLDLPDAAIEAAGVLVTDRGDDARALAGRDGPHIACVHEGSGTTLLHLWWAPSLADEVVCRGEALAASDPRMASPVSAWIVSHAIENGVRAQAWLDAACDELIGGEASVFAAAVLADHALRRADPDLARAAAGVLPTGEKLAWLHVAVACRVLGCDIPVLDATDSPSLPPADGPDIAAWRKFAVLGRGLPGETGSHLATARALAETTLIPERWNFGRWSAAPLSLLVEDATRRLLAERCADDALAWLLW